MSVLELAPLDGIQYCSIFLEYSSLKHDIDFWTLEQGTWKSIQIPTGSAMETGHAKSSESPLFTCAEKLLSDPCTLSTQLITDTKNQQEHAHDDWYPVFLAWYPRLWWTTSKHDQKADDRYYRTWKQCFKFLDSRVYSKADELSSVYEMTNGDEFEYVWTLFESCWNWDRAFSGRLALERRRSPFLAYECFQTWM